MTLSDIAIQWRGEFTSGEANALHAEAFATRLFSDEEWDWRRQVEQHSLGWVTARDGENTLVGFVNVIGDGLVHAWIQDVMVAGASQRNGVGAALVAETRERTAQAGCEWLHVDFEEHLKPFYFDACGFRPVTAGLIAL